MRDGSLRPLMWAAAFVLFALAATMNAGGYRYGVGDQAFYVPAALRHLDPTLFPRDRALIDPQDRFNLFTILLAWVVQTAHVDLPAAFLAVYVLTIGLLFAGLSGVGLALFRSGWATGALVAAGTLRHAVAMGAVNTLEGYGHPRMLAFAMGTCGVALFLRRRSLLSFAVIAAAGLVHPTTALWFLVLIGVGLAAIDRRARVVTLILTAAGGLALAMWVFASVGALRGLERLDATWLALLAGKRYLFAARWPAGQWLLVAAYTAAVAGVAVLRLRQGVAGAPERGLLAGVAALALLFSSSVALVTAGVALAVQLQVPRVLWIADLLAITYLVWLACEGPRTTRLASLHRAARAAFMLLAAASVARGSYVMLVEHPERPLVRLGLPSDDWHDAMRWVSATTPADTYVLADPGHAWRYGTSVRVAARRDVFLEEVKDTAIAMYSRDGARRVAERVDALVDFTSLTADRARALASAYGLDLLVAEQPFNLPLAYQNARFRVYRLDR